MNTGKVSNEELVNTKDLDPMGMKLSEADKSLRVRDYVCIRGLLLIRKSKPKQDSLTKDKEPIIRVKSILIENRIMFF